MALLGDRIQVYKIGIELYAGAGMAFARELRSQGKEVFLDMKFYDIPETVRRAVCQVARAGLQFLTLHGSHAVMRASFEGRDTSNLQQLAVTLLTSFDRQDIEDLGYPCEATDLVDLRVRKAMAAGMQGIVASPLDAARVRRLAGAGALLVTPGVRSVGAAKSDQKRVATPAEAIREGADYVVVGRQVTRAADPVGELDRVLEEIATA